MRLQSIDQSGLVKPVFNEHRAEGIKPRYGSDDGKVNLYASPTPRNLH